MSERRCDLCDGSVRTDESGAVRLSSGGWGCPRCTTQAAARFAALLRAALGTTPDGVLFAWQDLARVLAGTRYDLQRREQVLVFTLPDAEAAQR